MTRFSNRKIGSVCRLVNGRAFKPSDWGSTGVPIIRIQNLNDAEKPFNYYNGTVDDRHKVDTGDVLLSWSGTPGTSFGCFVWDRGPGVLNQHIFKVHVDSNSVDIDYFVHAVNSKLDEMIAQAHGGVGLRHITKGKLEEIDLPVPTDLKDQQRIANWIKECMSKAKELRSLREIGIKEANALDVAVFGDVIESWSKDGAPKSTTLGDLLTQAQYGTSSKANTLQKGVPVLRMGNIQNGELDVSDLKHIEMTTDEVARYRLNEGDILINRTNSLELVGKAATFKSLAGEWVYASYLVRLVVNQSKALPEYITAVINSRVGRDFVLSTARRAIGMVNINAKEIRRFPIPLPELETQQTIIERLETARNMSRQLRAELDTAPLLPLQKAILRKAFSGEV